MVAYPNWALVVGSILTTYLVMLALSKCLGAFEPKYMPFFTNVLVGGMGVGSICFMNYSLRFNSVGVYQMAKLCIIPVVLIHNALKGEFASRKVQATLALVLFGVGVATVTDVELSTTGLIFASAAVLSTAQYQIWQGSKQREAKLSDMQMTMSVSGIQIFIAGVFAFFLEGQDVAEVIFGDGEKNPSKLNMELVGQILLSCLLAVSANAHSFALIGRTSAVTWQVVGHGKTCLIIAAGYLLFPLPSMHEFLVNASGVALAVLGVILYSNLKMNEGKAMDWCDLYAPKVCLDMLLMVPNNNVADLANGKILGAPDPAEYSRVPVKDVEAGNTAK